MLPTFEGSDVDKKAKFDVVVVQLLTNGAIIGKLLGDSIRVLACRKPWGKCSLRPNIRDGSSISTAISSLLRPALKQSMWPKS